MKLLVVDDERLARARLIRLLGGLGHDAVDEAPDGIAALARIAEDPPDVVLLDIRMPGLDGLQVARAIGDRCAVVFTTAYDAHALAAFELDAVDYLVKPVRSEHLERALERARRRDPRLLERVVDHAAGGPPRIAARHRDRWIVVDPRDLTRLFATDKLVAFRHEGQELLLDQSLSALEAGLEPHGFLRVHRSELINLSAVRALRQDTGGWVAELSDGQEARVGRRMVRTLKARLGIP